MNASPAMAASPSPSSSAASPVPPRQRIAALDIIRGLVMVLMAIDHVRVYSGQPAGGFTAGIFFTRWVTNFCAPVFVFLAGTGAFLHGQKLGDRRALSRYLFTRGMVLVMLELTFIRFTWSSHVPWSGTALAGVIWMLGWCMVILSGLVRFSPRSLGIAGVAMIAFQQGFSYIPQAIPEGLSRQYFGLFWEFFYPARLTNLSGIAILYVIIPWIGVMMAGYAFGEVMTWSPERRKQFCIRLGVAMTVVYLVVGSILLAIAIKGKKAPPFIYLLLGQNKYPPSQLFLLMTLGPMIALIPLAERARGWLAKVLTVFGKVPMFYYLMHIPAIHVAALLVNLLREGAAHNEWYAFVPMGSPPKEHMWSLPLLYLVFVLVVVFLYFPCRWYLHLKARHKESWLSYI